MCRFLGYNFGIKYSLISKFYSPVVNSLTYAFRHLIITNVIKTIASMTKKKAHLLYTKQIGGLFHVFMDISQFAFMFPMSLNVTVMNVYLSVLSDNLRIGFINWNLRL